MTWMPKWCRAVVALLSVTAMTLLFVMPAAWVCIWFGWLPRAQLLPAIMSGEMTALALIAVSVALFGPFMKAYVYDFIRDVTKGTDVKFIDYWDDAEFQDERLYATSLFLNKTGRRRFTKKVMGDCIMKSNGDVK